MLSKSKVIQSIGYRYLFSKNVFIDNSYFIVSEEVRNALESKRPVVALESTIVTHGMPYPSNVECALEVEQVVREQGAVPATVSIINGKVKVGTTSDELNFLGDTKSSSPVKTSRRDLAFVLSNKRNGGTTVAGTLVVANRVHIPIFATGGIGGVHRGAERTFDISADLTELGRSNVAVVSSGVKSILDIPKTLEYLETQGVLVATFGENNDFPAFYSRVSGCKSSYFVNTPTKAAEIIKTSRDMDLSSGLLFAVPIPEEHAIDPEIINEVIDKSLKNMPKHIEGKSVTPYLLAEVAKLSGGKSLTSNIALIKNNAATAAKIAVALSQLEGVSGNTRDGNSVKSRPVIIGGTNLDCSAKLDAAEIKLDGRMYHSHFSYSSGGVGRNICESLYKLGVPSNFLTVLGSDEQSSIAKKSIPAACSDFVQVKKGYSTAQCVIVFNEIGDCKMLMGDMEIHRQISPEMIKENEEIIKNSPLLILDGNLTKETLSAALELADKYNVPVFFEPTDIAVCNKPFETPYWPVIKFVTPNLGELKEIAKSLNIVCNGNSQDLVKEAADVGLKLAEYIDNIIVTLGSDGIVIVRRGLATDNFCKSNDKNNHLSVRHYPTQEIKDFINVSGAGDCFASGFIAGMIDQQPEDICVSIGFSSAKTALYSSAAVPKEIFQKNHQAWKTHAIYNTM